MKAMSARQVKVAKEVQHLIALALIQGRIPSTLPLHRLTVVECWVSADLRIARVFVEVPADVNRDEWLDTANEQLTRPLRKHLATALSSKNAPEVSFWPVGG